MRLLLAFALLAPLPAQAGNRDSFLHGNEAAMTAGATTAWGTDGGMLLSNPAGLGANGRRRFSLNGNAFALRIRNRDRAIVTNLVGAEPDSANSVELLSAPTAGTFLMQLNPSVSFGVGSFTTVRDQYTVETELTGTLPDTGEATWARVDLSGFQTSLALVAGLGWQAHPAVRLGFSLIATYERDEALGEVLAVGADDDLGSRATFVAKRDRSLAALGWETVAGIQLAPISGLRIGVTVRTPHVVVYEDGEALDIEASQAFHPVAGAAGGVEDRSDKDPEGWTFRPTRMPTTAIALGWEGSRFTVGLEADVTPPQAGRGPRRPQRTHWALRAGARGRIAERIWLGGGVFTDRDANDSPESFVESQVDWYGLAAAVRWGKVVGLGQGERAADIVLESTLGLRYAIGVGQAGTLDLSFSGTDAEFVSVTLGQQDVQYHEVSLHIGSSMRF